METYTKFVVNSQFFHELSDLGLEFAVLGLELGFQLAVFCFLLWRFISASIRYFLEVNNALKPWII